VSGRIELVELALDRDDMSALLLALECQAAHVLARAWYQEAAAALSGPEPAELLKAEARSLQQEAGRLRTIVAQLEQP
jgi:hypothetical protein